MVLPGTKNPEVTLHSWALLKAQNVADKLKEELQHKCETQGRKHHYLTTSRRPPKNLTLVTMSGDTSMVSGAGLGVTTQQGFRKYTQRRHIVRLRMRRKYRSSLVPRMQGLAGSPWRIRSAREQPRNAPQFVLAGGKLDTKAGHHDEEITKYCDCR
eukprot:TRINITY_DN19134_c0_g1_i1.p1 TRINITY_DN19134_c0_g1~~TRINITY_DN19134_c0_g1_i1.p1  ORF type:complete len:156 (-),score=6.53 TRINITY_DN19134_c0_g1_i1:1263-1730(-)